ncbi:MAG: SUMF1/EgtB/PvdO family nonheme iron enzyme [Parvularculaceae bacterium]
MPDVFISYNREDRDTARLVASALEAEGLSVWWDAALRAGETYDEVTEQNLRQAGAVVVLWSKRSVNSKWVRAEATVGERSSTLVPVLIEECERPIRFELVQTADLRHWRGDRNDPHWRAFMQDVRMAISKRGGRTAAAAPQSNAGLEASMETTFWNSIKDGSQRSDFEAYLKRYPNGHFASLAQNRLAALARAPSGQQAAPAPRAAPARPAAQTKPAARQAPPPAPKKSGSLAMVGGIALLLAVIGVGAFLLAGNRRGAEPTSVVAAAPESAVVEDTAPADASVDALAAEASVEDAAAIETTLAAAEDGLATDAPPADEITDAVAAAVVEETPAEPEKKDETAPYRDCDSCPLMQPTPGGVFMMGSPSDEGGRNAYEGPQREVTIKPFSIGAYEVTNAEWKACVDDGACRARRTDDEKLPVLGVSWRDAGDYAKWLSRKTGRTYRLPTEAEWEFAARGGAASAYWWGDRFERARVAMSAPQAVGSYQPNGFGLYDVLGNAREWVADCYVNNYVNAPIDGSAVTDGDCGKRVIRGGAWSSSPVDMRVANRSRIDIGVGAGYMGFRIAADAP